MASKFVDEERNAYLRGLYARSPKYRLGRINNRRAFTGLPPLTIDQLPPYRPWKNR